MPSSLISRMIASTLKRFAKFPVVVVLGPRQSGKTTLVRMVFDAHGYVNLEHPATLAYALQDPEGFLDSQATQAGLIIDEFQNAPQLLSYLQVIVDEKKRPGFFVLTGSQNFLMNQAITQSLAGRAGILHLLPLSVQELRAQGILPQDVWQGIFKGGYPRIWADSFTPQELFPSYIRTYIERDIRQLVQVSNLHTFTLFMKLCAGRVGQLLNKAEIATQCGVDQRTIRQWLSLLEACYVLFLVNPYHTNFNKRLIKTPKLYFYDTGLACSLLGMTQAKDLILSPFRGALFENYIIADLYKQFYNQGREPALYFWRDTNGRLEVDCLLELQGRTIPIELKSGQTINPDFFTGLQEFSTLAGQDPRHGMIVYGGDREQKRSAGHVIGWQQTGTLLQDIMLQEV